MSPKTVLTPDVIDAVNALRGHAGQLRIDGGPHQQPLAEQIEKICIGVEQAQKHLNLSESVPALTDELDATRQKLANAIQNATDAVNARDRALSEINTRDREIALARSTIADLEKQLAAKEGMGIQTNQPDTFKELKPSATLGGAGTDEKA